MYLSINSLPELFISHEGTKTRREEYRTLMTQIGLIFTDFLNNFFENTFWISSDQSNQSNQCSILRDFVSSWQDL